LPGLQPFGPARPDFEGGITLAAELIASKVTGVLAFNDLQALGIVAGYRAAGLSVPHDLSVVGSDDIAAAAMSNPPLTTVAAPVHQLGDAAFDLVAQLLAGTTDRAEVTLPVTLTVRASTPISHHQISNKGEPPVTSSFGRRQFLKASTGALAVGVVACSDDGGGSAETTATPGTTGAPDTTEAGEAVTTTTEVRSRHRCHGAGRARQPRPHR
jgi:hypothetical protein